jgi:enoyl-CoA hydratase/carnithine racemase
LIANLYDGRLVIRYHVEDSVAWLTLDRPDKLNAMTREFWQELREALAAADADPDVRVAIVHGEGRCFSVGGDIEGFGELTDEHDRRAYVSDAIGALLAVEQAATPTIAAVHGHALGGGCELTMVCDLVVADETAAFGTPEARVGLVPGLGILRGRSHVNSHWIKYMIFTGATLDAEQARLAGLVQSVVPAGEHLAEASRWAAQIAERSPLAIRTAKAFLGSGLGARFEEAVETVTMLQGSDDHAEGVAAFAARRAPLFSGR